jgi:predicted protein tyrosine phosphatase
MFRSVALPPPVSGRLLLHGMPGRYELLENAWRQVQEENVGLIVCLAEPHEIREKSVEYAQALADRTMPCAVRRFGVPDRGAPADREEFRRLIIEIAQRINTGQTVSVHCAGGVGRTGMVAICVLIELGQAAGAARAVVSRAGSTMETAAQSEIVAWYSRQFGNPA